MRPPLINSLLSVVERASKPLLRDFGELSYGHMSRQAAVGYSAAAIQRAERKIQEEILKLFPTSQCWLSSYDTKSSGFVYDIRKPLWIIEGLDGLNNFKNGLPHWAVAISLYEHPQITASLVYDPIRFELYWAYKGAGAFLNQKRLRLSTGAWTRPVVATEGPLRYRCDQDKLSAAISEIFGEVQQWGSVSLALAYTASGRYDGFVGLGLPAHLMYAGLLMVKEAGGIISDVPPPFLPSHSENPKTFTAGNRASALALSSLVKSWNSDSSR